MSTGRDSTFILKELQNENDDSDNGQQDKTDRVDNNHDFNEGFSKEIRQYKSSQKKLNH